MSSGSQLFITSEINSWHHILLKPNYKGGCSFLIRCHWTAPRMLHLLQTSPASSHLFLVISEHRCWHVLSRFPVCPLSSGITSHPLPGLSCSYTVPGDPPTLLLSHRSPSCHALKCLHHGFPFNCCLHSFWYRAWCIWHSWSICEKISKWQTEWVTYLLINRKCLFRFFLVHIVIQVNIFILWS